MKREKKTGAGRGTRRDRGWSMFAACVDNELLQARDQHPKPLNSAHEAYAVIREELDEFWDEVKKRPDQRDPLRLWIELTHVAAMCRRAAEDVVRNQMGGAFLMMPGCEKKRKK